jgi:hypothetical protein
MHSLLALPDGVRYDEEFFCASILPDIERNLCDGKHSKTLRGVYFHRDNASAHNARRPQQEIAQTNASRVVHPTYSPDVGPSDFFLFGHLEGEMARFTANSSTDILSEVRQFFQKIIKATLVAVYDEWITRLE